MRSLFFFQEVSKCFGFLTCYVVHMHGYIDCHCHISSGDFDKDIEEVVENSKKAGLLALLAVAEHAGEFDKIIALSQRFPGFVFPCLGVHPVQEVSPEQQRGASPQVGLDFTPRYVSEMFIHGLQDDPPSTSSKSKKQKLVKQLPLENICLETDSPALGPEKQM
ncbi:hypothetical protein INR49_013067 [Caranx melampygus]|nr:hypothetical protein INR49_013067 [Caranx melampygus]